MFRTRRSCYIKRLSKLANEAARSVEVVLKKLDNQQLENLMLSVESKGAEEAPCIVLPVGDEPRPDRGYPVQPHVRFCQLWRWSDLRLPQELKKLPVCQTPHNNVIICVNPYHWSYLSKPDSPPPPYSRHPQELSKSEDSAFSESRLTSQLSGSGEYSKPWCKVAYWELNVRVGRQFQTSNPTLNVFADLPHGDGMCLETLASTRITENASVLQTRTKIGQGITMFKEDQKVWVYNRSEYPLFVNSPTLDPPNSEKLTVYKLLPGYCINIFDYELSKLNQRLRDSSTLKNGPIDEYAVRISFAKGWGSSKYSRRCITCCPCWLEVMFLVHR
ncbi:mothers against decapentaplegic homolog 6 isoform X1 [Parasteatoda tepidariorum]|uniref:mothers against decapentaplegic homolog 6 isoform X1 n=1 Tax=Parasteatoda tepidariorum TaxID=114398 RepID=UPI00077FDC44|nr:mothers against decapentaplegic homolog 6 [Parasteatoda tepidariorum]